MRNTISKHTGFGGFGGKAFDPWARKPRITRAQPRRDDDLDEHGKPKKKPPFKVEIVPDDDPNKKDDETPEQLRARLEESTKTTDLAKWLLAESQFNSNQLLEKNKTEAEREFDRKVQEAVAAQVIEATTPLHEALAKKNDMIVDMSINLELARVQIDPAKVKSVIDTLDRTKLLNDDGSVKEEAVKSLVSGLAAPSNSKPPRTTGTAAAPGDRGFGRYASSKQ